MGLYSKDCAAKLRDARFSGRGASLAEGAQISSKVLSLIGESRAVLPRYGEGRRPGN